METFTEVRIFSKPKKVYNAIAKEILKLTQNSTQENFDIALSGGNSPKGLFKKFILKISKNLRCQHDIEMPVRLKISSMINSGIFN